MPQPREEHVALAHIATRKDDTRGREICRHGSSRRSPDGHDALLRALAKNPQEFSIGDDILLRKRTKFAHAQSATIKHFEDGAVAQGTRILARDCIEHSEDLGFGKRARQGERLLRRIHQFRWIVRYEVALLQIAKEHANRRRATRSRRTLHPFCALFREKRYDVAPGNGG